MADGTSGTARDLDRVAGKADQDQARAEDEVVDAASRRGTARNARDHRA